MLLVGKAEADCPAGGEEGPAQFNDLRGFGEAIASATGLAGAGDHLAEKRVEGDGFRGVLRRQRIDQQAHPSRRVGILS